MSKRNNKKLLEIMFYRSDLDRFFKKELGFAMITQDYYRNTLLMIRDKKKYPDCLDMDCYFDEPIVKITFHGLDFIGPGNPKKTNYTDEEFFEDVKEFCILINQA